MAYLLGTATNLNSVNFFYSR